MSDKPTDLTKAVQTRAGQPARVICTDRKNYPPVVALVTGSDGSEAIVLYRKTGEYCYTNAVNHPLDLVNVPERRSLFRVFYMPEKNISGVGVQVYTSFDEARRRIQEGAQKIMELVMEDNVLVDVIVHPIEGKDK